MREQRWENAWGAWNSDDRSYFSDVWADRGSWRGCILSDKTVDKTGSGACWVTVCAMSPCWHSHLGVFAVLLLLRCDNSQQVFLLQTPKLTPYNICRLFCGQCPTVTATVKQIGWGESFTTKLLLIHLFEHWNSFAKLMGSSCAYTENVPLFKKKKFLWNEAMMVFVLHPQRCKEIHECRKRSYLPCCLLTLSGLGCPLEPFCIHHNYLILPCIPFKSPKKPSHRRNYDWSFWWITKQWVMESHSSGGEQPTAFPNPSYRMAWKYSFSEDQQCLLDILCWITYSPYEIGR